MDCDESFLQGGRDEISNLFSNESLFGDSEISNFTSISIKLSNLTQDALTSLGAQNNENIVISERKDTLTAEEVIDFQSLKPNSENNSLDR